MAPADATGQSGASASSHGGRQSLNTSNASLNLDLDQDALKKALNTIHNAASQSQNLTTFNDYTEPPPTSAVAEDKSLVSELQGGLAGLYNKFKASVGGGRESTGTGEALDASTASINRLVSQPTSGRVSRAQSRVQSPRLEPSEFPLTLDTPLNPSKVPSKAPSTTKTSGGSTPTVKSPTALQRPTLFGSDSALGGVKNYTGSNTRLATLQTSMSTEDFANYDRNPTSFAEEQGKGMQRVFSRTESESKTTRQERKLISPTTTTTAVDNRNPISAHERGLSDVSMSKTSPAALIVSVNSGANNLKSSPSVARPRQDQNERKPASNPVQLLAEHRIRSKSPMAPKEAPRTQEQPLLPMLTTTDQNNKLVPRVSQSRLPGFPYSRASSTDSGLTRNATTGGQATPNPSTDGAAEKREHEIIVRPPSRLKSKLISKEFWMRDENARDCFRCGEPFTTFRRKHHCRVCGQIFDNKCTTLVSGNYFGQSSAVRVCKPCEIMVASHDDDSSDFSIDDIAVSDTGGQPHTPDLLLNHARYDDDNISVMSQPLDHIVKTPTMSLPIRKAYDDNNRSSAVFEFDASDRPLPRPSSSRSLKSHFMGHGHKRHPSRHQHIRSVKAYHDDRAPFQRRTIEDVNKGSRKSAFHRDSIIDPDLAQYLSDDASSEDEQSIQTDNPQDKLSRSGLDNDRLTIGGFLAAVRKGRSRIGDRSIAGFLNIGKDSDDAASIISTRAIEGPRMGRKRNLSVASSIHHRLTPKGTRERLQLVSQGHDNDSLVSPFLTQMRSRMIRSASMHNVGTPTLELNKASRQHAQKLLRQLLQDADIPRIESWEAALTPIILRATDDVDPDVQGGDDIDIRNYVKLKKISGGRPYDTAYVSGLVFTKNIALKSMSRAIVAPRILIISFPLEYARYEQHFMSLDPVIRQEREYLENVVSRIAALKPDVLLSQQNISGLALELLDLAKITTVFNVKSSVIEAVSRCTQTRVANSMDKLGIMSDQLGMCDSFDVKTFVAEGRKKTYIYLSGCPPHLGCTIALRGAERKTLSKIKRITDFMVFVVYNLKLETCLMRDEWALIPSQTDGSASSDQAGSKSPALEDPGRQDKPRLSRDSVRSSVGDKETRESPPYSQSVPVKGSDAETQMPPATRVNSTDAVEIPDDIPVPTFYEDLVEKHQTTIVSASPFVKFAPPYLLMQARKLERQVAYLQRLRDQDMTSSEISSDEKGKSQKFTLIQPEMVHTSSAGNSKKVREIIHAVHDAEYDKALHNYETQKKQWEASYLSSNRNLFDPYAHQNVMVLFSVIATATSVPCSGPDLLAFSFYNEHESEDRFEADCTLGQFVEDLCYRAYDTCPSEACENKLYEHHRQYVHGEARVTVSVLLYPAKMRGLQDVILMWSQCKKCGVETTVTPMSPSTWKYSFGKYLELSFWSADLHARAGVCPHDLHRDHARYFGYKDLALRINYDPIDLLEVAVPRMRITWKVDNDLRYRNGVFTKIESRMTRFMGSVKLRLKSINADALLPEIADACRAEIELLTKKANEDHTMLIKLLQDHYTNSQHWEIIPLNRAFQATVEKVTSWDNAFAEFEKKYFPSEKDIRRLATIQLKKIFLDRDVSVTTLGSGDEGTASPVTVESGEHKNEAESPESLESPEAPRRPELSREKTQNVLQAVLEEHGNSPSKPEHDPEKESSLNLPEVPGGHHNTEDVQHLDLALHSIDQQALANPSIPQLENPSTPVKSSTEDLEDAFGPATPKAISRSTQDELVLVNSNSTVQSVGVDSDMQRVNLQDSRQTSFRQSNSGGARSPTLVRAQSQPAGSLAMRSTGGNINNSTLSVLTAATGFGSAVAKTSAAQSVDAGQDSGGEEKLSDRLRFSTLKHKFVAKGQSFIPRAIANRKESRVSNLAKHFEQLSREFERERVRERKLRAARTRQSRIYPLTAPKPIVEVYKDVNEAVDEDDEEQNLFDRPETTENAGETVDPIPDVTDTDPTEGAGESFHTEETPAELTENETEIQQSSHAPSEVDEQSEDDASDEILLPDSPEDLMKLSQADLELKELPKHERTSLMKMLTSFWAERSSSGWASLEYPFGGTDHIFADCDIIVREDEPSSIIAFALDSSDYKSMLHNMQEHEPTPSVSASASFNASTDSDLEASQIQADVMHSLLRKTGTHLRYQFEEGSAKMLCKIFFAEQFDAMRRKCGVAERFVESMSRCVKWDSKGGKTKSLFLKTSDERFVLKSLSPIETQSFLKFAPNYFQIMSEAFFHELPSVIAKMLGFYQIITKNPATGVEYNLFLLVMENLFYDRKPTRLFDLKGSMRNRKINATGERDEVLLDENMVEFIYESPLFAREHSKKLLRSSVHNDTLFLARQNVMDYSLMIGIEENRNELVVGIIDCIRTYTWDKKLESWIKDRGFAGGGKNRPTVTSPKEYKRRFREAMNRYVLEAPSCWYNFKTVRSDRRLVSVVTDGERAENELQAL